MTQNRPKTFGRGVHPPEHKDATKNKPVKRLGFAPELVVLVQQHLGVPATPIVRKGQEVVRGEPVAGAGGFVSVPMHAPATGTVAKIDNAVMSTGRLGLAVTIKPYPGSTQEVLYTGDADIDGMAPADIVSAVQETGMVGLGGAAFPTHVKMAVPKGKTVDTVIANGCECEPFLTNDHRLMLEQHDDLFRGIAIAIKATGAREAIIGVEDNKPDVIDTLRRELEKNGSGLPIRVEPVKTMYPQGAEKMLIKALLRREVPSGGLPVDVNVAVFNVATLAQLADLLPQRRGLIERIVTVTGPGVEKPGNYLVPLGTPLRYIFDEVGLSPDARQVILGGPMMGLSVASLDVPVTKGVSGILVLTEEEVAARPEKVYPCIKCGQCVLACPMSLNPSLMGDLARRREYALMQEQHHLNDCFECACCTYVCPSNIPLVQYFRVAKALNREKKQAT